MKLPPPETDGKVPVESAIRRRRTVRSYARKPLDLEQLSQLLWAAQGITEKNGFKRAAPSAGALYPMDVYAVIGQNGVAQVQTGVFRYQPRGHQLAVISDLDLIEAVAGAALSQMWMAEAPVNFVITAEYSRIAVKYGDRGVRYAMIEAGHVGQNLFLQAEALGLKAGIVGAFHDRKIIEILQIPASHEPLLVMPVGYAG